MLPHPLDLIALILGILFTLRRMETSGRDAKNYPDVASGDFEVWRKQAQSAYRVGTSACFGKVLLDIALAWVMKTYPMPGAVRMTIGISLDLGWVALMVLTFVRTRRAHALARTYGIERRAA